MAHLVYFCAMDISQGINAQELFRFIRNRLEAAFDPPEARQMAALLLEHFAGMGLKQIIAYPATVVEVAQLNKISEAVERLLRHEPLQYITGFACFCGNEFRVNPDVLIPRPETEELVRWVLDEHADKHNLNIADIGTGTGCIAISLWLRLQDAGVDAYDISADALKLAVQNNEELGSGVKFHSMDFLNHGQWPDKQFDIIVSNPPYIPLKNKDLLPFNVSRFEPAGALFVPDDDPLVFYKTLAIFARSRLKPGGMMYVEVHEHYAEEGAGYFRHSGFGMVELRRDLNEKNRMVRCCL